MRPKHLRQLLLLIIVALLGVGTVAVYSASAMVSEVNYGGSLRFLERHLLSIACGAALGLLCLSLPYAWLRRIGRWGFLVSIALLILVAIVGHEAGGARRWFQIGRWSLQPSELAQLTLVIYLADLLARRGPQLREFWSGLMPPLLATGLMAVLVLIQPDLGTAIAMGAVALLLLGIGKAKSRHLVLMAALAAVVLAVLVAGAEYRRRRIFAFLDPWQDPQGGGYQIIQSYLALAGGGLLGRGIGSSLQKLFYLPSAHTDFIFAILGEELGLLGTTAVLVLFGLFLGCGFRIAIAAHDPFSKYLVCGLVGLIGLEAMVNIAVVTGLLPTKGLPLPFISFGGSSMVMNLVACALIFQASRYGERPITESALGR
ncbi:MAG: putative lipid II flippase FtsW [Candidatus Omnitrophica bacterium]|nr:putative lipid II flippase FtsW [Candidatus Omnitrophota bacterium]